MGKAKRSRAAALGNPLYLNKKTRSRGFFDEVGSPSKRMPVKRTNVYENILD
jgi:hypothetical protein